MFSLRRQRLHAAVARYRRNRCRSRPSGQPGGCPAARQAQADLHPPRGHRRFRDHRQRRQGRPERRQADQKHYSHSGYPGGLERSASPKCWRSTRAPGREGGPGHAAEERLGRKMLRKLKVYAGHNHPHTAQKPVPFEITRFRRNGQRAQRVAPQARSRGAQLTFPAPRSARQTIEWRIIEQTTAEQTLAPARSTRSNGG